MFYVGLDLGQRRDHAAIAVVERLDVVRAFQAPRFEAMVVRYVERILLGTPYPRIVSKARDLVSAPELQGNCKLIVDASGVGVPVVDMLRHARLGCEMTPIGITGGEHAHQHYANGSPYWTVPRQDLIAGVHLLLEQDELRIAPEMKRSSQSAPATRDPDRTAAENRMIWCLRWLWLAGRL